MHKAEGGCTKQKEDAEELQRNLPTPLQRSMELSQEKGASIWLTALPIDEVLVPR